MNDVIIDKMTFLDLKEISNVLTSDFDEFWNSNILESEIKNPFSTYIVAKIDTEIVGFAGIIDTVEQFEITNIVVKKNYRGRRNWKLFTAKSYKNSNRKWKRKDYFRSE